ELLENTSLTCAQKDYVGTIRESSQTLMLLINNILDVSKIEAGELKLEEIDFDLSYLLKSVIKMNSTRFEKKDVRMLCAIDENMPKSYKGDPTRIRQILTNLISNAIKFTEKGEIRISAKAKEGVSGPSGERRMLEFSVKDTGIGIPKEKHERIFEAFEQADTSTTRKYGGTGLGLTISKTLVAMMGGKIWVESTPGHGSEFFFTLNLEEAAPVVQKDIAPLRVADLKGKKVLIVNDNESASKMVEICCREAGMDVLYKAASVKETLDWLSRQTELPEIILSDIMMPKRDGYELARAIKKSAKTQAIKLVAVTSDVKPGAAKDAEKAGFDAFLPNPVFKNDLIEVMRVVLGDNRGDRKADQIVTRHMAEELACKGLKILVVEDNLVNQKLLQVVLKNFGCEVDVASNGQVAVEKVKTHRYDLVLMDIQMPGMGGCEATEIIRSQISKTLPILALTATVSKEDEQKSLAAGMNDFITKPVALTRLRGKIIQWANPRP
ncbi:MAG: response regulator, partial [Candidatus Omnitrophota bacterium]